MTQRNHIIIGDSNKSEVEPVKVEDILDDKDVRKIKDNSDVTIKKVERS